MFDASAQIDVRATGVAAAGRCDDCSNREAALLALFDARVARLLVDSGLTKSEWRHLLYWLDVSGLALYFADRLKELQIEPLIPEWVRGRFQQNLSDNSVRMRSLLGEFAVIQAEFSRANVVFALTKGFSLWPFSVPNLELRHQLDLDFVIDESHAAEGREILEHIGYRLNAISGASWEFSKNKTPRGSLKNTYRDGFGYTVELHLVPSSRTQQPLVERVEYREIEGLLMPVLRPTEAFVRQGLHVFKDVCSSFMRAAHLVEFSRHLLSRRDDSSFWSELRAIVEQDRYLMIRLGAVLRLVRTTTGINVPEELEDFAMGEVPASIERWLTLYGRRCVYGTPPGTKMYLLLQRELELAGVSSKCDLNRALLPRKLPPAISPATVGERPAARLRRSILQLRFVFLRLRFHIVEGLRYSWECYWWRRYASITDDGVKKVSFAGFSTKR